MVSYLILLQYKSHILHDAILLDSGSPTASENFLPLLHLIQTLRFFTYFMVCVI